MLLIIAVFYGMLFFAWWTEQPENRKVRQVLEGYDHLRFLSEAAGGLIRSLANGEWWKAAAYGVMLPFLLMFAVCFLVVDVIGLKKAKEKLERFSPRLARRLADLSEHADNPDEYGYRRDASAKQSTNEGNRGNKSGTGTPFP